MYVVIHRCLESAEKLFIPLKNKINTDKIKNDALHLLGVLNYADYDLGIWVTDNHRLCVLLVHGICHLLGYDHQTDEQHAQMKELEDFLCEKLTHDSNGKKH